MKTYLMENEISLEERQKNKLLKIVEQLGQEAERPIEKKVFHAFFSSSPSIKNGFKVFDYEKLCAMVLFFAHQSERLLKVKLLKLLNYSDMIFYQENGVSISGTEYIHFQYGPVPQNYDILFGMMALDHVVHIEVVFDNGYEKHQVVPECAVPEGILSQEEIDVLERIHKKFADFGSFEISNYSHKEKGYSSTKQGEVIPYSYAKDIQL